MINVRMRTKATFTLDREMSEEDISELKKELFGEDDVSNFYENVKLKNFDRIKVNEIQYIKKDENNPKKVQISGRYCFEKAWDFLSDKGYNVGPIDGPK